MYEFHHALPNELRESSKECQNFIELSPSSPSPFQKENFINTSKKLLENQIELFPKCAISHRS